MHNLNLTDINELRGVVDQTSPYMNDGKPLQSIAGETDPQIIFMKTMVDKMPLLSVHDSNTQSSDSLKQTGKLPIWLDKKSAFVVANTTIYSQISPDIPSCTTNADANQIINQHIDGMIKQGDRVGEINVMGRFQSLAMAGILINVSLIRSVGYLSDIDHQYHLGFRKDGSNEINSILKLVGIIDKPDLIILEINQEKPTSVPTRFSTGLNIMMIVSEPTVTGRDFWHRSI